MSYALFGLGAPAPLAPCGANSARNPVSGDCECNAGFTWVDPTSTTNVDCKPRDPKQPCTFPGQRRSPVDLTCWCPPGMYLPAGPTNTTCVPMRAFPNCKDSTGKSIPNCFMGYPLKEAAIAVGAGALLGLLLGRALS